MENDARTLLFDIVESSRLILEFTSGIDFEEYAGSEIVRSAVERQFINIGEALHRLSKTEQSIFGSISDAAQIIAFRNVLVHGYDVVSDQLVWEIINERLPELKEFCEGKLNLDE